MRKSWSEYFMDIARMVATRSTCNRKQVGCVIVRDNRILVTGYNGSLPKQSHCTDDGCYMDETGKHCLRTTHAEANAVAQAAQYGISLAGTTVYCTLRPCITCDKLLAAAGVECVYYVEEYPVVPWSNIIYAKV